MTTTTAPDRNQRSVWDVVLGVIMILLGLWIVGNAVLATAVSVWIIGWFALVAGVIWLIFAGR